MDDLISRQAVLDGIEELKRSPWYQGEGYVVRKDAVEIVEQLCVKDIPSAQPEPKWIPVKWREPDEKEAKYYTYMADCEMPEDEQEILVTDGKYVWKEICFYDDGFHLDSGEDWQNITAWMPLPEPYTERREDG